MDHTNISEVFDMEFFIDTASVDEIRDIQPYGLIDGVTTNPSLLAKEVKRYKDKYEGTPTEVANKIILEILKTVGDKPVSVEVTSIKTSEDMIKEAMFFIDKIGKKNNQDNIVVKIPMTMEGLKAVRFLSQKGIKTNVTLIFQPLQALMCAKAGATYVSPFVGRLDDISTNGMDMVSQIQVIFCNYDFQTKILVASIRNPLHVLDASIASADVVTMPFKVIKQLVKHPLTDIGIDRFARDNELMKQQKS